MTTSNNKLSYGEHELETGVTVLVNRVGTIDWRDDCSYCVKVGKNAFAPNHDASLRCESGKRPHCSCSICF